MYEASARLALTVKCALRSSTEQVFRNRTEFRLTQAQSPLTHVWASVLKCSAPGQQCTWDALQGQHFSDAGAEGTSKRWSQHHA